MLQAFVMIKNLSGLHTLLYHSKVRAGYAQSERWLRRGTVVTLAWPMCR